MAGTGIEYRTDMTQDSDSSRLQSEIDRNLKRAYEEMLNQDLPDRFHQLIAQLREAENPQPVSSEGWTDGERHVDG